MTALNTFRLMAYTDAHLSFLNVPLTPVQTANELTKHNNGNRFLVRTDGKGLVEIEYEPRTSFTIGVFNRSRWATTIHISSNGVFIGNNHKVKPDSIETRHTTTKERRIVHTTFKITNESMEHLKRIDVKGDDTKWFSIFSHDGYVLCVRPNGDWVSEKMQYMQDQVTTQAVNNYRRHNGWPVLGGNDTLVMHRRHHERHERADHNEQVKEREVTSKMEQLVAREQEVEQKLQALSIREREIIRQGEELTKKEDELAQRKDHLNQETEAVKEWEKQMALMWDEIAKKNAEYNERRNAIDRETQLLAGTVETRENESPEEPLVKTKGPFKREAVMKDGQITMTLSLV